MMMKTKSAPASEQRARVLLSAWNSGDLTRLRTTLTACGIAFAVMLIVAAYSLQGGAMGAMRKLRCQVQRQANGRQVLF